MTRSQAVPITPSIMIVDSGQLAAAMRKWLCNNASDQEEAALLMAGYLKFIPQGKGQLGATAKGWQEAQNPKRVSEITRTSYGAEQRPNWCPRCQTYQFPFEPEKNCRTCGTQLITKAMPGLDEPMHMGTAKATDFTYTTDAKRLDAYGRFARHVQRAVEEEDGYDALKQAIRAATTVLHDELLEDDQ